MADAVNLESGDGGAAYGTETVATYRALLSNLKYACSLHTSTAELFSSANIELWEALCPNAMGLVQCSFGDAMLLTICRICDPAESGPKTKPHENCTFARLALLVEIDGRPGLAEAIRARMRGIEAPLERIRFVRHKFLGHLDQVVSVRGRNKHQIDGREVIQVLSTLATLLEEVGREYEGTPLGEDERVRDGFLFFGGLGEMPDGGFGRLMRLLHEVREGRSPTWPGSTPHPCC